MKRGVFHCVVTRPKFELSIAVFGTSQSTWLNVLIISSLNSSVCFSVRGKRRTMLASSWFLPWLRSQLSAVGKTRTWNELGWKLVGVTLAKVQGWLFCEPQILPICCNTDSGTSERMRASYADRFVALKSRDAPGKSCQLNQASTVWSLVSLAMARRSLP